MLNVFNKIFLVCKMEASKNFNIVFDNAFRHEICYLLAAHNVPSIGPWHVSAIGTVLTKGVGPSTTLAWPGFCWSPLSGLTPPFIAPLPKAVTTLDREGRTLTSFQPDSPPPKKTSKLLAWPLKIYKTLEPLNSFPRKGRTLTSFQPDSPPEEN